MAFALHDGHAMDGQLKPYLLLDEQGRAREEDPYTGFIIADLPVTTVTVNSSRFMVDLNRTKEKCIYLNPEDAWGLKVWKELPQADIDDIHADYDFFYETVAAVIKAAIEEYGYFVILDVHSYNHKRQDADTEADTEKHPEINMGTAWNLPQWKSICREATEWLSTSKILGHPVDARENILFKGGAFAQWVIENFGVKGLVLSVEFKKTFMDEWTGVADIPHVLQLRKLMDSLLGFLETKKTEILEISSKDAL